MDWDLIVIGGGAAGLTAARVAARLGARVLLIEKRALGGDCLFTGCVPSKTLIRTAQLAHEMRTAERFGLPACAPAVAIDAKQVMARVRAAIARIGEHDSPARFEALGAEVRIGAPAFVAPDALELDGKRLTARAYLICTGSRPAPPPSSWRRRAAPPTSKGAASTAPAWSTTRAASPSTTSCAPPTRACSPPATSTAASPSPTSPATRARSQCATRCCPWPRAST